MDKEKYEERVKLLDKVKEFEKNGRFDVDVLEDPPAPVLEPDQIDYLKKKLSSKVKNYIAVKMGVKFYEKIENSHQIIIKDVIGIENLNNLKTGGIITSNHFNPFEALAVEKVFRFISEKGKTNKLYAVIREGNYTNFPGLYGFLFRNGETLPLSSNHKTMKKFYSAVEEILNRGDFILIYPEQSMWWNYQKPKPLKDGAYHFSIKHDVPIIPFFITTKDSEYSDDAGFPILEYYIHIQKPIYKENNLTRKDNIKLMKKKNFEVWQQIYEDFYKIPLEYNCNLDLLPDYVKECLLKRENQNE